MERNLTRGDLHRACCDPLNAINWALDYCDTSERAFLEAWRLGDLGEYGDYVAWVQRILIALRPPEGS